MSDVRQRRQQQTRDRLLSAAALVFAREGYHGASIPQIAREADVSTGAIYANFPGKEGLFLAMMARQVEAGAAGRADAVAAGGDRDELLGRMTREWTETVDQQPDLVLLMAEFWLYAVRHPDLGDLLAAVLGQVRANLAGTISSTLDELGDARVTELAAAVQALAYGFAMQRVAEPDAIDPDGFARAVAWLIAGAAGPAPSEA